MLRYSMLEECRKAMESLKTLRRRIRSIESTRKITRAMEMVSAAKLRKTEHAWYHAQPYYEQLRHMILRLVFGNMPEGALGVEHPFLKIPQDGICCLVIISSDRGLCGSFNTNLIHRAEDFFKRHKSKDIVLYCIGRRAYSYFHQKDYHIVGSVLNLAATVDSETVEKIAGDLENFFLHRNIDEIHLLYSRFVTRIHQYPMIEQILPMTPKTIIEPGTMEGAGDATESIIEPDRASLVDRLLSAYIRAKIRVRLLEAFASEHSARMITMTNATRNCIDLIEQLTLKTNKARQAAITRELLDIVSGGETFR